MKAAHELALVGGHPVLDFANTVGWHAGAEPLESLVSYASFVQWARHAALVEHAHAALLSAAAAQHPRRARAAIDAARNVRELLYRIFTRVAHDQAPAPEDLAAFHEAHVRALSASRAEWQDGLVASPADTADLLAPVHRLVIDAAELMRSAELHRIRQCANDPCGWLFIDRSRNGSRRWCSSTDCGNEHRVRQFRARHR